MVRYLRTEVVRPLLVHVIIAWSTLQRHTIRRTELKKAEFEEKASRITYIGAAVNFVLAFFKPLGARREPTHASTHGLV